MLLSLDLQVSALGDSRPRTRAISRGRVKWRVVLKGLVVEPHFLQGL